MTDGSVELIGIALSTLNFSETRDKAADCDMPTGVLFVASFVNNPFASSPNGTYLVLVLSATSASYSLGATCDVSSSQPPVPVAKLPAVSLAVTVVAISPGARDDRSAAP